MPVPRVRVVLVVTLGSGPVNNSPHVLLPLCAAVTVLNTFIVVALHFLLLLLLVLLIIRLLTEKCLVGHAKELHCGNIDYAIVVVIVLLPSLFLHVIPISIVVIIVTAIVVVVIWFLIYAVESLNPVVTVPAPMMML